ncbi:MAG: proteinase inhibitor, partial [Shewanella sp.]
MVASTRYALLVCASAFVGGQLVGCSAPEAADTSQSTKGETTTAVAVQPEIIRAADLALDVSGLKSTPTLKAEPVMAEKAQGLLRGELTLEPFIDFKQSVKATLTVTNPQTYAVGLRYNSGMTADLWLVT